MRAHTTCLICTSPELKELKKYRHAFLCKCRSCGFVFSKRVPEEDELAAHYATYPRNVTISALTLERYDELLKRLEPYRKLNTILDIGCGDGHFLDRAKQKGWQVYGTEYTDEACRICASKGIAVNKGKLDISVFSIQFDVIVSIEVLEHIYNPREEIVNIHRLLRSGGIFYFTTPNFNSLSRYLLKSGWSVIEYPEHLCYYTSDTACTLLKKNSFIKIKLETSGLSPGKLLRTRDKSHKTLDEKLRQEINTSLVLSWTKKVINFLLNLGNAGDTIKGTFKKE